MAWPANVLLIAWMAAVAAPLAALLGWPGLRRRRPLIAHLALGILAAGYGLAVWAFLVEPGTLAVRHVTVTSLAWRGTPLRIGVISDTHAGSPHVSARHVRQVMDRLSAERPDVIVLLGDYVGGHEPADARTADERAAILSGVAALGQGRAPHGRVAVLGNHDWWYDGPAIQAELRRSGVRVLENEAVRVARPGGAFWIAGLADMVSRRAQPSTDLALSRIPQGEPVVLLTHWPDPFPTVPARVALTLAGHTHCGQVNLPFVGRLAHASEGARRWGCGLYDEGGRKLFVTGGVGTSILPVRFRAPPEIVIVTLREGP